MGRFTFRETKYGKWEWTLWHIGWNGKVRHSYFCRQALPGYFTFLLFFLTSLPKKLYVHFSAHQVVRTCCSDQTEPL